MANTGFEFKKAADSLIASLGKDRDREILTRRFGLGAVQNETLDKIGKSFGITRERVRQVERSAIKRIQSQGTAVKPINQRLLAALGREGGVATLNRLAAKLGASGDDVAYVYFLAKVAPDLDVIDDNKDLGTLVFDRHAFSAAQITSLSRALAQAFHERSRPAKLHEVVEKLPHKLTTEALNHLADASKALANFGDLWGLKSWPQVNPRSIKDRAYLALAEHGGPLHFSEIAAEIDKITPGGRKVTTQAVHNELIKDDRFVLIGRGIYALSDWGYTAGTVADMIKEVLSEEQPLHKDEIIKRVLQRRQVKSSTIALNLQEKRHFERVAKATYKLKAS